MAGLVISFSQASLATAIGLSTAGILVASRPPNPTPPKVPDGGDSLRKVVNVQQKYGSVQDLMISGLALHQIALVLTYPNPPASLLRNAAVNGINTRLITWSKETAIPLALILCIGVPLRFAAYGGLGKNFTFGLSTPDRLKTTGLYRYLQHPSYTGAYALALGILGLWLRPDGVLSCFISPKFFPTVRRFDLVAMSAPAIMLATMIFSRVKEEEQLLRRQFGAEWEDWHARTARFIPFLF
ncbi:hypothetical protein GGR50DRAFT_698244 [Xylaria sp. CBS 124048]|nr:hypothetical protein GGR50DRAFT_698244 [Xylaria sp. CBS 124048]